MQSVEQQIREEQQIVSLVELFLRTGYSDNDLSKLTGIPSTTVGRRLSIEEKIIEIFNHSSMKIEGVIAPNDMNYGEYVWALVKEKREFNKLEGRKKGGVISQKNNVYGKNADGTFAGSGKLDLNKISSNPKTQMKFLALCALTFGLNTTSLSNLLGVDEGEVTKQILNNNPGFYYSLNYLFNHAYEEQTEPVKRFKEYYVSLINALSKGNSNEVKDLYAVINDRDVMEFKKNRVQGKRLTDEEVEMLIQFQLKYGLDACQLAVQFNMHRNTLARNIRSYFSKNPKLESKYNALLDYNSSRSRMSGARK